MMLVALVMQGPLASGAAGAVVAGTAAAGGGYGTPRPVAAAPRLAAASLRRSAAAPSESIPGVSAADPDPGGRPAPAASPSRAGSPQGEGRPRPGRPDSAVPDPFASDGVPIYTDRDPQQARQPTGEGRRVDGDRARGTADTVGKPKASPSAQHPADSRDGAGSGNAHDEGVDRKGPGRGGTAGQKAAGTGIAGDMSSPAPDKWRARPARNVRDEAGTAARATAPPQAAEESTFRPLPFGTGLILIGLGLGFLGVRLRRS